MSVMLVSAATLSLIANAQLGKTSVDKMEIFGSLRHVNHMAFKARYGVEAYIETTRKMPPVPMIHVPPCEIVREYIPGATSEEIAAQIARAAQCYEYQVDDYNQYVDSAAWHVVQRAKLYCADTDKFPRTIWNMGG